jgi:SOS-response transcriptional repressor LexA
MLASSSDNFSERLRFWRVSQNFTQAQAAVQLDIDRAYLSQIERGRPPGNALRTRFLLIEKTASVRVSGNAVPAFGLRNLPVLSWAQAGQATDFGEIPPEWDEVVPSDIPDEKGFAVRLRGDSMEPRFADGDIAILQPSVPATNGEIVVANLKNQGVVCKIMHVQLEKKLVKLSSYNPAYPPMEYRLDDFHWIFPVAAVLKQLRRR